MSDERETELYNHLQGLSKDEIIGITIREFNENRYFREVKIGEYLKENQQLKEGLKEQYEKIRSLDISCAIKEKDLCFYEQQLDLYKSVLDEIREYIEHEWFKRGQLGIIDKSFQEWQLRDLLQILDKVKE